ncbi:hypothetical protein V499_04524 [Pseudogymnoascus sp. VKM F-103]|nr:hypothetical protein V499_04524 [Pseudogymnoascus sp. VKM F-103]
MSSPPTPSPSIVPPYNRTTLTRLLTRHYTTLSQMGYIPPTSILHPPASGWSDSRLNTSALRLIGRNETVIELLKHIPYLDKEIQVWPETEHLSYLDRKWESPTTINERMGEEGGLVNIYPFSPHKSPLPGMVTLTHGWAGVWWVIDTDTGLVWPSESHWTVHAKPDEPEWMWLSRKSSSNAAGRTWTPFGEKSVSS